MADVFISYSHQDRAFVRRLFDSLEADDRDAWVDWEDIPPTAEWLAEIYASIESAENYLFVISPDSIASRVCSLELAHAVQHNKRLIPIVYRQVADEAVPEALARLNWIFMRESDDFSVAFGTLIETIDTDLEWVRAHTRLLVRAREWEDRDHNDSYLLRGDDLDEAEQQLAQTDREPRVSDLQAQYILASRKSATRRQRTTLVAVTLGLVVAIVLGAVAFSSFRTAQRESNSRATEVANRTTAEVRAQDAADARATEVVVRTTAEADAEAQSTAAIAAAATATVAQGEAEIQSTRAIAAAATADRRSLESQSLAQVAYARQAVAEDDHSRALAHALAANSIPDPPGLAQVLLAERAYAPGAMRTLEGHEHWVRDLAFSPDGETILSLSDDDQAIVWDADGEEVVRRYVARPGDLLTPDLSGVLALRNEDYSLTLTDLESGEQRQRFEGHVAWVTSAAFSPKGAYLVAGAQDGAILMWDVRSGERVHTMQLDGEAATSLAFRPDGMAIAAGTEGGRLYLWDTETWRQRTFAGQHSGRVTSLAFTPDGNRLVSGSYDTTLAVWNLWSMDRGHTFTGHYGSVITVAVSPDGKRILSGGCGQAGVDEFCTLPGQVILWDIERVTEMQQVDAYREHGGGVFALAFSPDSRRAASGGTDRTIVVWDVGKPEQSTNAQLQSNLTSALSLNPDTGQVLAESGNSLVLWDLAAGEILHTYSGHEDDIFSVSLRADGRQALSGDGEGTVMLWDVGQAAAPRLTLRGHTDRVTSVAFGPDGRRALSSAEDGTMIYWDLERGEPLQTLTVQQDTADEELETARDVALSPDGSYALAGLSGGAVLMWDLAGGGTTRTLAGHTERVNSVTFSPDGRQALSGSSDTTLILWDVPEGTIHHTLEGHRSSVTRVVFSPDGTTAISGDGAGTLVVWNLAMGEAVREFHDKGGAVRGLAFGGDGTRVLSSSPYTQIVEWRVDSPEALQRWVRANRIVHDFTCQERELYRVQPPCETRGAGG